MVRTIAAFPLSVKSINHLGLDPFDGIGVLLDDFVHDGTLAADDEHEQLRCSAFLTTDFVVEFIAGSMDCLLRGVDVAINHNGVTIDSHSVIVARETESSDEIGQGALGTRESALVVQDKNSPSGKLFRLC